MGISSVRVLVVDDFVPWHAFICDTLKKRPELEVIGKVADGSEAVRKVRELQPDLILLDIGLPTINGIQAAREIRELAPDSKILFVSESRSLDIVNEALRTGSGGYVVKSDAAGELLPAVEAVLQGRRFVSASLENQYAMKGTEWQAANGHLRSQAPASPAPVMAPTMESSGRHRAQFYSDDASFLHDIVQFLGTALEAGNAAIVLATPFHRDHLLSGLRTRGVDVDVALAQGRYIPMDAANALANVMRGEMVDPVRFFRVFSGLIVQAAKTAKGKPARVAAFGECSQLLCVQGNVEAAIQMERAASRLVKTYDVDLLCGYCLANFQCASSDHAFQQICAEHSAAYSI